MLLSFYKNVDFFQQKYILNPPIRRLLTSGASESGFHKMCGEYLYAYRQEDYATEELGLETTGDGLAETDAEQVTRYGEEEGYEAYDEERKRDGGERRVA